MYYKDKKKINKMMANISQFFYVSRTYAYIWVVFLFFYMMNIVMSIIIVGWNDLNMSKMDCNSKFCNSKTMICSIYYMCPWCSNSLTEWWSCNEIFTRIWILLSDGGGIKLINGVISWRHHHHHHHLVLFWTPVCA